MKNIIYIIIFPASFILFSVPRSTNTDQFSVEAVLERPNTSLSARYCELVVTALHYINGRLEKKKIDCIQYDTKPGMEEICAKIYPLLEIFEKNKKEDIDELVGIIVLDFIKIGDVKNMSHHYLNSCNIAIRNKEYQDKIDINMGRMLSLYTFTGVLCIRLVKQDMRNIAEVISWNPCQFTKKFFVPWLKDRVFEILEGTV